jgi:hypothetical protein
MPAAIREREDAPMAMDRLAQRAPGKWAYETQLLLRGVGLVGYPLVMVGSSQFSDRLLVTAAAVTGVLLLVAGVIGLSGLIRPLFLAGRFGGRAMRLADGLLDVLFGLVLLVAAWGNPRDGIGAFGVWAVMAGLLLAIHAFPNRLRDRGPAWAWLWTGGACALSGLTMLAMARGTIGPTVALLLGAFAFAAATMSCLLGFGLVYPLVLELPDQTSSGETMFAYDDIHWVKTPPELEGLGGEPPPKSGQDAA